MLIHGVEGPSKTAVISNAVCYLSKRSSVKFCFSVCIDTAKFTKFPLIKTANTLIHLWQKRLIWVPFAMFLSIVLSKQAVQTIEC